MAGFSYGNARLRAMRSRLLTKRELFNLAEAGNLKVLIAALARTSYRGSIETALGYSSGLDCISEALVLDLANTLGKASGFYMNEAREIVEIVLRAYDVNNLKAILRGLWKNAPTGEILQTLVPIGSLDHSALVELARAPGARAAIDLLASMASPFARPLVELRAELPGADISRMDLVLDQWYFREAKEYINKLSRPGSLLSSAFDLEADLTNLLTVLRFAHSPRERRLMREWLDEDNLELLFVVPGKIPYNLLLLAGMQDTVEAAVTVLASTIYASTLRSGMEAYARSGRLSDIEKQLRRFRLNWMRQLIYKDPLGIGVLLGFQALKVSEIGNIRWIAQGINLSSIPAAIQSELEFVS